jgi:hypothetical protein
MNGRTEQRAGLGQPRKFQLLAAMAAATVMAVVGCGGDDGSEGAATTAPAGTSTEALLGNYTTTLGPSGPELSEPNPPGTWGLRITSETDAYFQPPEGPSFPVGNPIEVSADRIVLAPDPECPTQEGSPAKGTYEWQLTETTLTLTEVSDTCRDRAFVLTSKPWSRTK